MASAARLTHWRVNESLTSDGSAPSTGGETGNGSRLSSMMRSKRSCRLADLSSLESCSASVSARNASSNCSRTGGSTAASRCFSRTMFSAQRLQRADDVVLGRLHAERRAELGAELLDDRAGLAEA